MYIKWFSYRLEWIQYSFIKGSVLKWYWVYLSFGVVVQSLSCVQLFAISWTAACQASLSFTISWSLFKLMSTELVMSSNHLILWRPLLLMPQIFPSIRVFYNESALRIRWPKYWSFSINPPMNIQNWFPLGLTGLISLQFDLDTSNIMAFTYLFLFLNFFLYWGIAN